MSKKFKENDQWKGGSTGIRPPYYSKYPIDPWTFIIKNQLGMDQGSVIKYVVRHQDKNGVEDKTLVMAEFDADKNEEIDQLLLVMNFKVNWSRY
jgi:hypothetical protein